MAITIPDVTYKETEDRVAALATQEKRSKTQMAVILIEEAMNARAQKRTDPAKDGQT